MSALKGEEYEMVKSLRKTFLENSRELKLQRARWG